MNDLLPLLDAAKQAALHAADVLEHWRLKFEVKEKAKFDLVTDADLASQQAIQSFLTSRFPDHAFLGEEEGASKSRPPADAPPTWIVDPIDGTTNYVHDCPFYCISIGLQIAGELVVGVVYDPPHKEMFAAAKGHGAWLNERKLKVSATPTLNRAMLATGFPPDMRGNEQSLGWWRHFSLQTQALRRTGSTALNLAFVAAGRFDAFYAFDNHVWDVAAGVVLVREAGGIVTNVDGTAYDPFTADGLASNGHIHSAMVESFRKGL
jgi:myo-inositol-1(or 4)-monophosphatase